jgi:hypothetical protein
MTAAVREWTRAVRHALTAAHAGTEYRVSIGDDATTVTLLGGLGVIATCTVRRAAPAPKDARQRSIDDLLARNTPTAPVPAPAPEAAPAAPWRDQSHPFDAPDSITRWGDSHGGASAAHFSCFGGYYSATARKEVLRWLAEMRSGQYTRVLVGDQCIWDSRDGEPPPKPHARPKALKTRAPADTPAEAAPPPAATVVEPVSALPAPISLAQQSAFDAYEAAYPYPEKVTLGPADDRGADLGEDGREYPDGEPYATVSVTRAVWQRYRRALGDDALWGPDPDDAGRRIRTVSKSQHYDLQGAALDAGMAWYSDVVTHLLNDPDEEEPEPEPPAPAPTPPPARTPSRRRRAAPKAANAPVSTVPAATHWILVAAWEAAGADAVRGLPRCSQDGWTRDPSGQWTGATVAAGDVGPLRALCAMHDIPLHEGATPPGTPGLHRDQPHPECDALARSAPRCKGELLVFVPPDGKPRRGDDPDRPAEGYPSPTWYRTYFDGVCAFDSRDAGAP